MGEPQYADVDIREQLLKAADLVEAASTIYKLPNVRQGKKDFYNIDERNGIYNVCILSACHLYNLHLDAGNPKTYVNIKAVNAPSILREAGITSVALGLRDFNRDNGFEPEAIGYIHHMLSDMNDYGLKPDEIVKELRRMADQLLEGSTIRNVRIL